MNHTLYLLAIFATLVLVESSNGSGCGKNEVRCNRKCITLNLICDGGVDCEYGADEKGCPNKVRVLWNIHVYTYNIRRHILTTLSWLRRQKRPFRGWGRHTNRVVVAIHLSNPGSFNMSMIADEVIARDLQFELLEKLRRSEDSFSITEMAQYSHALLAICMNPKDFFGFNIIQKMEIELKSKRTLNSFVALAICNSNGSLPHTGIVELINILKTASRPELIDQQAYALMTLNCLRNKSKLDLDVAISELNQNESHFNSYDSIKNSTVNMFINLQQEDGNFGDVYTTALVIQAILSSESDNIQLNNISKAFNYISQKALNRPFQDIIPAYLLLPLLNGKTLFELGRVNCSLSPLKAKSLTERFQPGIQNQRIWYSIRIENEYAYDMALSVPINSTFYDVMVLAADTHKKYRFESVQFPDGKYVTSLSDVMNNAETRKYWYLFRLEDSKPTVSYIYPDKVIPKSEEKFVYWYRSTIIDNKEEL